MSRSFQKKKIIKICGGSDKIDKNFTNKSLRRRQKVALLQGKDPLPVNYEVSDQWCFSSDGKYYCRDWAKKHMRK